MKRTHTLAIACLFSWVALALPSQAENGILAVGDRPPALSLRLYKSTESIDWDRLENQVVVLEFWATWCQPCIENIPKIDDLVGKFTEKHVSFISVSYESEEMIAKFLKQHPMHTMIGLDNDFAMFRAYRAWGIPIAVVVNANGKIACVIHPNKPSEDVLNQVLAGKVPHVEQARPWPDPKGAEEYFRSLLRKAEQNK